MKRWLGIAVLVLVGLAGSSCSRDSSKTAGRLTVEGRAEVVGVDGGIKVVTRSRTLRSGEEVRLVDGTGTLSLGGDRRLELRRDSAVRLTVQKGSSGQNEPRAEVVRGDVLVTASGEPAVVRAGDTIVQVPAGTARVARGLTAVYEGAAGVESSGRSVSVPALRQVTVPAPGLPSRPSPIVYSATDSWDQRFLGDAIELSNQLVARSRGFTGQVAANEGSVEFFRRILPGLASQTFDGALFDPKRQPGETLVGAAISLEGTKGTFPNRWASIFSFHDEGAPWGLVALDQGVNRAPLLAALDAAIARLGGPSPQAAPVANPTPNPAPIAGTPASNPLPLPVPAPSPETITSAPGIPTTPSQPSGGTVTTTTVGTATTPTQPAPLPGEDRGPVNLGIPLVDDTLNAVVDTLSGLLRAIGGS